MKNMNIINKIRNTAFVFVSIFSLSLFSCGENSGLGSEVDTEAPKITITYPPASAIIRENFEFGGTWTDDKTLNYISVTVTKVISDSKKEKVYEGLATINEDGSWIINLNVFDADNSSYYNGWQFSDGSYEISATAKDNAGNNSGTASRGYQIDNTAPVLVLTKPTSYGSNTAKKYGRTVQFEGTFSELCSSGISKLKVAFFDENGNGLFDDEFENISDMSDANPLVVAKFFGADERDALTSDELRLWENYKKLYGDKLTSYDEILSTNSNDTAETAKLFFTVTASDAAKIYRNLAGGNASEDSVPNSTTYYYRGTTDMLSLIKQRATGFENFTVLSLRNYLNKTDETYQGNALLKQIVEEAVSVSSDAISEDSTASSIGESIANVSTKTESGEGQNVYLNFSVNPQNNPTYTAGGMTLDFSSADADYTDGFRNYIAGSDIVISFDRGLDGANFDTSSITVYYIEADDSGNPKSGAEKQLLWTYNEDVAASYAYNNGNNENGLSSLEEARLAVKVSEASAKQYRYTITSSDSVAEEFSLSASLNTSEIMTGNKYLFRVEGKDIDGQEIIKSSVSGFGFFAKSNSSVPVITIGSYDSGDRLKNRKNLSAFTKDDFENTKLSFSGIIETELQFDFECADPSSLSFTVTVTDANSSNKREFNVPKAEAAWTRFEKRVNTGFVYDWAFTVSPTDEVKSLVSAGSGLYTVDVTIKAKNSGEDAVEVSTTRTYYLDTKLSDFSNVSLVQSSNDYGYKAYEDTDRATDSSKVYYLNNSQGNTFIISGTSSDNYKISHTTYRIEGKSGGQNKTVEFDGDAVTDLKWEFDGIDLGGFEPQSGVSQDVIIYAVTVDEAGNESKFAFNVKFDTTPPEWSSAQTVENWYKNPSLPVSGGYSESGSGVADIYYWIQTPGTSEPSVRNLSSSAGSFKAKENTSGNWIFSNQTVGSFEANDSKKTPSCNNLYLVATDNAGNRSVPSQGGIFEINLDIEAPKLTSNQSGMLYTNKINDIELSGTYSDNASGVKTVDIKLNGKTTSATLNPADNTWTAALKANEAILSGLEAGKAYSVSATVTDNASNTNPVPLFNIQVDTESPVVKITAPSSETVNSEVSFAGTVEYTLSTPEKLKVYYSLTDPSESSPTLEENGGLTALSDKEFTGADIYSWSLSNINVKELSHVSDTVTSPSPSKTIYIIPVVYDEAGNCSIYTETWNGSSVTKAYEYTLSETENKKPNYFAYTVDQNTDRPVIKFMNIESADSWLKTTKLSGTVSDDDGISKFEVAVKYADNTDFLEYEERPVSNGNWTYTFTDKKDSENIQMKFRVTDTEGTVFETGKSSLFERPYILYSKTEETDYQSVNTFTDYGFDNNDAVTIKLDTASPKLSALSIAIGKTENELAAAQTVKDDTSEKYKVSIRQTAGGKSKLIKIYAPAFDLTLDTVIYKITDSSGTPLSNESASGTLTEKSDVKSGDFTYYESGAIDISAYSSGTVNLVITAKDKAGKETSTSASFVIDNDPPEEPSIISPTSTESLTGDVELMGTVSDTLSSMDKVEWCVPYAGWTSSIDDSDTENYEWHDNNSNSSNLSFKYEFVTNGDYDLTRFEAKNTTTGDYIYAVSENTDSTYKIPLLFRVTDSLGNSKIYKDYFITHNPDGDRPVTELTYPVPKDYDMDSEGKSLGYATLSGRIQVTGSVEIPTLTCDIGMVYVQIGKVTGNDSAGNPVVDWSQSNFPEEIEALEGAKTSSDVLTYVKTINSSVSALTYAASFDWGVETVTKSASWSVILNSNEALNPEDSTESTSTENTTKIAIRACGVNENGKFGIWTAPVYVHIDKNAPSQSGEIREYNSGLTVTASNFASSDKIKLARTYNSGMYLRGTKYFVVTITDNDSIDANTLEIKQGSDTLSKESGYYATGVTGGGDTEATMQVCIPVVSTSIIGNSVTYSVSIKDSSGHASRMSYTFSIDNTAPAFTKFEDSAGKSLLAASPSLIADDNYRFSMNGNVSDTGAGFEKFFFQFVRKNVTDGSAKRVLDPMLDFKETSPGDGQYNYSTTYAETKGSVTAVLSPYAVSQKDVESSGTEGVIYGKTYTASGSGEGLDAKRTSFTASGISSDQHIRAGGLIYIAGDYQIITKKDGDKVTFEDAIPSSLGSISSAGFPYGQVVNNLIEGKTWNSSQNWYNISSDDDDGMPEEVKKSGTNWSLNANIKSTKMPDGPVTIVVVAFDKAGNIYTREINTSIQNNAPRLAKLHLGTDLSGDEKYSDYEFNTYTFVTAKEGKVSEYKQAVDFETASDKYATYGTPFKIKDGLAVVPEITGGNGEVKMAFLKDASSVKTFRTQAQATAFYAADTENVLDSFDSELYTSSVANDKLYGKADSTHSFVIPNGVKTSMTSLASVSDGSGKAMSFTFWDSTEGCVCGKDSNYCFVRVSDFEVDLVDDVNPKSVINPFYWNSLTDNSVWGSGELEDDANWRSLEGHIELEKDLSTADKNKLGDDPKVSGKITLKGYAYDDRRLSNLWISFDGFTPAGHLSSATKTSDGITYYKAASYKSSDSSWECAPATMNDNGWCFSVDKTGTKDNPAYLSQKGHKVFWTLSIDTSKIANTAQKDVKARLLSEDKSGLLVSMTASTGSTLDGSYNVPFYQMDVVPYITEIETTLSSTNPNNPTIYSRSSSGHYPVYMSAEGDFVTAETAKKVSYEEVTLKGFNLSGSVKKGTVTFEGGTSGSNTVELGATDWSFNLPSGAKSGLVKVTVNEIDSLNNTNKDDACGDYDYTKDSSVTEDDISNLAPVVSGAVTVGKTGSNTIYKNYYNRKPNGENNNRLTDEVYVDVWQFNSEAAIPTNNSALDIMMKVNPSTGLIGFAFCDGDGSWSMADGSSSSYKKWAKAKDFIQCTGFAYDPNGVSYGTALGGESGENYGDTYDFFTSKWGTDVNYTPQNGKQLRIGELALGPTTLNSDMKKNYLNMAKNRYKSPSIASDGTRVYLAYFDLLSGEIRFQGGGTIPDLKGNIGTLTDSYTTTNGDSTWQSKSVKSLAQEHELVQVVADGSKTAGTLGYAGEYVSIGIAGGHVVMCWYDSKNGNLEYAYLNGENVNTPATGFTAKEGDGDESNKTKTKWIHVGTLLLGAGKYCQLATASDGSVHIACFDSANGDLKYVYLSNYAGASRKTCTVDSYQSVGRELTIDVAGVTVGTGDDAVTYQVPHIGYYGTTPKKPRYATLSEPAAFYSGASDTAATNGAVDDLYTGIWDCSIVPCKSKITQDPNTRRINVGVWKTSAGVLKDSKTSEGKAGTSSAAAGSGICWGNGTDNAVLGYGVINSSTQDFVETAQKR